MARHRRGVVAVIRRGEALLAIRRAACVEAPDMICFPGGAIEVNETEQSALCREIHEELGIGIRPITRVWQSVTSWNVALSWWTAELAVGAVFVPNPAEVAEIHWLTVSELQARTDLLESNHSFLDAVSSGKVALD